MRVRNLLFALLACVMLQAHATYFDAETGMLDNGYRTLNPREGRYIQSDPIGQAGGTNTYAHVMGNPVSNIDPNGLECVTAGKSTYCAYPDGGPYFRFPTPTGQPNGMSPDDLLNVLKYHKYDVQVPLGGADAQCVMQELTNHPTPGNPSAATPGGTRNNAEVGGLSNWVTSYTTSDINNGNPVVVNVADAGSRFTPGYAARTVTGNTVHTYGEGMNWSQAVGPVQSAGNWYYWKRQMEEIVKKCTCPNP